MTDESALLDTAPLFDRRDILRLGAGAAMFAAFFDPTDAFAARVAVPRVVHLLNVNTGERLKAEYWAKGKYLKDALGQVSRLLRDHRSNAVHRIDPKLLDLAYALHAKIGGREPFHVVSGYRSPESNAALRHEGHRGVARHSMHMEGKAIDIRLPGSNLRGLYKAALRLSTGGVGFYPQSNFVHIDVGKVRHW